MKNADDLEDSEEVVDDMDATMGNDYGMDNLAKSMGLDIEAIALNLAL